MRYASVCAGIEAATVAWHGLGWEPVWFSEIEPFPCKVLQHHYPQVPNLGDMTKLFENETYEQSTIDLLVGGTPCQSFSYAGLRAGLSDVRGNLALQYCRILIAKQPQWFVWENVPGVLSSFSNEAVSMCHEDGERLQTADFATLLSAFRECGYSCAFRMLDAQYFGVPQRRRRTFVVGYLGDDWRPPAAVLFDGEGGPGDFIPCKKTGKEVATSLTARTKGGGFGSDESSVVASSLTTRPYTDRPPYDNLIMATGQANAEISSTVVPTLSCNHEQPILIRTANTSSNRCGINEDGIAYTLNLSTQDQVVCYPMNQITSLTNRSNSQSGDPAPTLTKCGGPPLIVPVVRRLTPLECERLQGFPDNYTLINGASNTQRYRVIGNSMAVPVMKWIGERIQMVDKILSL